MQDEGSLTVGSRSTASSAVFDGIGSFEKLFEALKLRVDKFTESYKSIIDRIYPKEKVVLQLIESDAKAITGILAQLQVKPGSVQLPHYDSYVQAFKVYLRNLVGFMANYAMHDILKSMIEDLESYKAAYERSITSKASPINESPLLSAAAAAASPPSLEKENIPTDAHQNQQDNAGLEQKLKEAEERLKKLTAQLDEEARLRREAEEQQRILSGKLQKQETAIATLNDFKGTGKIAIQNADSGLVNAISRFFSMLSDETDSETHTIESAASQTLTLSPDKYFVKSPPENQKEAFNRWKGSNPNGYGQLRLSDCVDMSRYCAICELVWLLQKLTPKTGSNGFHQPSAEITKIRELIYELLSVKRYNEPWHTSVQEVIDHEMRTASGEYKDCLQLIRTFTGFQGYISSNPYKIAKDKLAVLGNLFKRGEFVPSNPDLGNKLHAAMQVLNSPAAAAAASSQMKNPPK